jgi:kynureninase
MAATPKVITREHCETLDLNDPLRHARERFSLPDGLIYLDGNSLGALPRVAGERLANAINDEWGQGLIRSWNDRGWVDLAQRVGAQIAPLIGAQTNEVIVADSTSINLFKLLAGVLALPEIADNARRRIILSERDNFPSDLYIAEGLNALLGHRYKLKWVEEGELATNFSDEVAVALITQANYRTGKLHDMAALNAQAKKSATHIIWDLSHSAGAMPVALNADGASLAIGCGYKYFNGGPGAPAYIYVASAMQTQFATPLTGWFGHAAPFAFAAEYQPAPNMARFLCGTPSILATLALETGIATFADIALADIRKKSLALSDLFWQLMGTHCHDFGFSCVSPRAHNVRASHLSFTHESAYPIMQALIDRAVIGDFRQPNLLRFGFTPLYLRYTDMWDAVMIVREVMLSNAWQAPKYQRRHTVT